MNILVIGSGGREHAIIHALAQSPMSERIYVSPGNGGMGDMAEIVSLDIKNSAEIANFCKKHSVTFVVIGPEDPLVAGLADDLEQHGLRVFGTSKSASRLEGSKEFTKYICEKYAIPTAGYKAFSDPGAAKSYVKEATLPIVVKADGLAAGKGVIIAHTQEEALSAVDELMVGGNFGDAGKRIVIEEFLEGEEVSFFALVDGKHAIAFGSAQDHKAVGEGDTGPNTGGMGTYSPAPIFTPALEKNVMEHIITPLIKGMNAEGFPYRGILFAGLMITHDGPKLLEVNVRFGDPETQVLMTRLESDLLPLLLAAAKGDLRGMEVETKNDAAVCVVMATKGYPGNYSKGSSISLEKAEKLSDVTIFHAGTKIDEHGNITANGGRVLGVTATGFDVAAAQRRAYQAVDQIEWSEGFCRRDIAWRALKAG